MYKRIKRLFCCCCYYKKNNTDIGESLIKIEDIYDCRRLSDIIENKHVGWSKNGEPNAHYYQTLNEAVFLQRKLITRLRI
jgi:hypothetical protein